MNGLALRTHWTWSVSTLISLLKILLITTDYYDYAFGTQQVVPKDLDIFKNFSHV